MSSTEPQTGQPEGARVEADDVYTRELNDISRRFTYHPPATEARQRGHAEVRERCHDLAASLLLLVPPGPERSLALTHLEDVMMWSNAGIARGYPAGPDAAPNADGGPPSSAGGAVGEPVGAGRLVDPDDLTVPDGTLPADVPDSDPLGVTAPARNVDEVAEAPHAPSVPPEHADEPHGPTFGVMVPTTRGTAIMVGEGDLATRPHEGARWDVLLGTWEQIEAAQPTGGQPDTAMADPDTPTSP